MFISEFGSAFNNSTHIDSNETEQRIINTTIDIQLILFQDKQELQSNSNADQRPVCFTISFLTF